MIDDDDRTPILHDPCEFDGEVRASSHLYIVKLALILGVALSPFAGVVLAGAAVL